MKLYLGLDGGGTKTETLLVDENGRVLARGLAGASSITGRTREEAQEQIALAVRMALGGRDISSLRSVYAGISGGGLPKNKAVFAEILHGLLPQTVQIDCGTDSVNALAAGIGMNDGIIAIAGTGSSVFARKGESMVQVGGWGYMLGDEGSGFDLGRRAIAASLRMLDGRQKATGLMERCIEKSGMPLRELVAATYAADAKTFIASFARVLLEAAQAGDEAALAELAASAGGMAECIRHAGETVHSSNVVLGGSIWLNETYTNTVRRFLGEEYSLIMPQARPVCGAVMIAASADQAYSEAFAAHVRESYLAYRKEGNENG